MLDSTIELFEGESERLLWLPAITLGYIYTLSGTSADFWLAVAAVVGARFIHDLIDSWLVEDDNGGPRLRDDATASFQAGNSRLKNSVLAGLAVVYSFAIVYGAYRIYQFFTYTDPVLVGLAGIYWATTIIVLVNIDF